MFVITQKTRAGEIKYLADRSRVKNAWWVSEPEDAIEFEFKGAAVAKKNTLRYGENKVVDLETGEEF